MKKLGTALLGAASVLAAGTAAADLPEWTYADLGYYQADSVGSEQTDGVTLNASIDIMDMWHFGLGYIDGSLGVEDINNDFDGYTIRAGAHPAINESSQLVVEAIYFDTSYDGDGNDGDIDRDGYGFGVGVRTTVTEKVEASAVAYWTDAEFDEDGVLGSDDFDATAISVVFGGRYHWTENFSTGATVTIGDPIILNGEGGSGNSMNLDVRWTFGDFSLGN